MKRMLLLGMSSVLLGLTIALVLAEGALRLLGVSSQMVYRPDSRFGWSHTPDDHFIRVIEDRKLEIEINSLGLRDFEYTYQKPEDVFRILVLGDSFAEAFQVPHKATFAKILERRLNAGPSVSGRKVEVLNTGASGYGTDNELLFFLHEGKKYDPDLVVVAFYVGNDVRNNWYELDNIDSGGFRKPYYVPGPEGLELHAYPFSKHDSYVTRVKLFLNRHVRLYAFLRETRDKLRNRETRANPGAARTPLDLNLYNIQSLPSWETAWEITQELLLMLQHEADRVGAELFVVLIPTRFQVHSQYWEKKLASYPALEEHEWDLDRPNARLRGFLAEQDIQFLDFLPEMRQRALSSGIQYYFAADAHWNEEGHELAGELIARTLIDRGRL